MELRLSISRYKKSEYFRINPTSGTVIIKYNLNKNHTGIEKDATIAKIAVSK